MEIFLTLLLFALGLGMIIKGGDFFVDAASWMAEVSGIPKLIVGATVVSFATTLPELLVSVFAAYQGRLLNDPGKVDMAIGNSVGSVTANLALIMAISLLALPAVIHRKDYWLKTVLMLGATTALAICAFTGYLSWIGSILLLVIFGIAMYENIHEAVVGIRADNAAGNTTDRPAVNKKTVLIHMVKFVVGIVGIVVGAQLLVDEGVALAGFFGVPEGIIGVTIIAVGTSLPELVTTITAIVKKQSELSVGNIIGANIIDLTLILPVSMLVYGGKLPFSAQASVMDLPVCLLAGLIATVPALIAGRFRRWQGAALLLIYAVYVTAACVGVVA